MGVGEVRREDGLVSWASEEYEGEMCVFSGFHGQSLGGREQKKQCRIKCWLYDISHNFPLIYLYTPHSKLYIMDFEKFL